MRFIALVLAAVTAISWSHSGGAPQHAGRPMNIVVLVIDDTRWDSIGAAGNRIVRTPRLDATRIRGHPLHAGARRHVHLHDEPGLSPDRPVHVPAWHRPFRQATDAGRVRPNLCRSAAQPPGIGPGTSGSTTSALPRPTDFDFLRAYHGRHWVAGANGERVHVTEQNARDAIEFLRTRPPDKPFLLSVGYFAPHAEDSATEQYLPQDWSARALRRREGPTFSAR